MKSIEEKTDAAGDLHKDVVAYREELFGNKEKETTGWKGNLEQFGVKVAEDHDKWSEKADAVHQQLLDLLPGAAAVALAKGHADQKVALKNSIAFWTTSFILVTLFMISFGVWQIGATGVPETISGTVRQLIARAPIIAFAVWFMAYAGKKLSEQIRLQRQYAYREAQAITYVGFNKTIEDIEDQSMDSELRRELLKAMIHTASKDPSEIIDMESGSKSAKSSLKDYIINFKDAGNEADDTTETAPNPEGDSAAS